ncbi:hypothetical protein [Streptomyces decoyicus]|uniref:hypothetical protein n=1 Tax=Streptomyces decoyicus TaxID=249567 RepID=UPI0039A4E434
MLCMEELPYTHGLEPVRPTSNQERVALIAPVVSTAVLLVEGLVLGWLVMMTSAMCGNVCHDDRNEPGFSLILNMCGYGLVIPLGLLLISWLLPPRRWHAPRLATAILAPLSLGALYVLFNVWLALS